jgi:hypothetical protein
MYGMHMPCHMHSLPTYSHLRALHTGMDFTSCGRSVICLFNFVEAVGLFTQGGPEPGAPLQLTRIVTKGQP